MKNSLLDLLQQLDEEFDGKFIQQNIEAYVDKIMTHATIIDVVEEGSTKAFIAYYHNDPNHTKAFLSMLAIKNSHRNMGLGKILLNQSINHLNSIGYLEYELEVLQTNQIAIDFYKNNGFEFKKEIGNRIKMIKKL